MTQPMTQPMPPAPPPPPRPLRPGIIDWNSQFALIWGAGYGGMPLIILVVMMATMGPPWDDWILDQRAKTALATPQSVESTHTSVNDKDEMRIKVRFTDNRGKAHIVGVNTTADAEIAKAHKREPLTIDYDPEDTTRVRLHGHKASLLSGEAAFAVPMLVFVFILPGMSAFVIGVIRLLRRRSLYRRGQVALAQVVEHTESSSSENYQQLLIAHYELETPRGRFRGEIKALNPPPVGYRLWVIFDPSNPSNNLPA